MTKLSKAIVAAAAGAALLTAAAGSALAHGTAEAGGATPHMQSANMGQDHGGHTAAPNFGYGPHHDMKASMDPSMMMGSGTMGMMQQMHREMMGHGMTGGGYGHGSAYGMSAVQPDQDLSVDDVRARIERSLKWHGNERLKVGEVKELDDEIRVIIGETSLYIGARMNESDPSTIVRQERTGGQPGADVAVRTHGRAVRVPGRR